MCFGINVIVAKIHKYLDPNIEVIFKMVNLHDLFSYDDFLKFSQHCRFVDEDRLVCIANNANTKKKTIFLM